MLTKRARIRVTRRWLLIALLVYVGVGFAPAMDLTADGRFWVMALFLFGECALGAAHAWLPRKLDEAVRASEDGISAGGRRIASRTSMKSAHVRTWRGSPWLRIQRLFGPIDIALDSPEDEAAWLSALRLDASGVVARYVVQADRRRSRAARLRGYCVSLIPWVAVVLWMVATIGRLAGRSVPIVPIAALVMAMLGIQWLALARTYERVSVGADGLRLRRILGRSRFVSFASIASVQIDGYDVVAHLLEGTAIAWHRSWGLFESGRQHHEGFAARIERGLAAHRALVATDGVAQLARGARSVGAWVRDLRVASDPERSTYRVAALPADELWKTVESATAPPTARAGAAVALQRALDDASRKRLRDVAATCASDELRRALDAAAADDPALEVRLDALRDGTC